MHVVVMNEVCRELVQNGNDPLKIATVAFLLQHSGGSPCRVLAEWVKVSSPLESIPREKNGIFRRATYSLGGPCSKAPLWPEAIKYAVRHIALGDF